MNKYYKVAIWLFLLACILLLSYFGRDIQKFIMANISKQLLAWVIAFLLISISFIAVYVLSCCQSRKRLYHLIWFVPLFVVVPFYFPIIEERIHFIVFGVLGFSTMSIFSLRAGLGICLLAACGDELFQHYLPDRVGDWRDVQVNIVSVLGGAVFYIVSMKDKIPVKAEV
ncbi:MAG: VanZ family protein [Gammaproteobacteria bacterium]|nr:VanZ family protein [Gammaproteobacteria bacterium]